MRHASARLAHCFGTALATLVTLAAHVAAQDVPRNGSGTSNAAVTKGETQLPDGGRVSWAYHYDRNSLQDSRPVSGGWIALTAAGNLLLFDADLVRVRGRVLRPPAPSPAFRSATIRRSRFLGAIRRAPTESSWASRNAAFCSWRRQSNRRTCNSERDPLNPCLRHTALTRF